MGIKRNATRSEHAAIENQMSNALTPYEPAQLQDKALTLGFAALTDLELLTLLLGGQPDSFELAGYLLRRFQTLAELAKAPVQTLTQIPQLGRARAIRLQAALALGYRLAAVRVHERPVIQRPSDVVNLVHNTFAGLAQEHLQVILLDAHNRVMEIETVYIGSLNTTVVRVAEILRLPMLRNSAGIILVHNHPSGNATPSTEDIRFTADLVTAGKLLDIVVLDHLIIGEGDWVSLREHGLGFQSDTKPPTAGSA